MNGSSELIVSQHGVMNAAVRESDLSTPEPWLREWFSGSSESAAGVTVTIDTVMGIPSIWNSISKIAGHLGQMPLECRKWINRKQKHSEIDERHPSHWLVTYEGSPGIMSAETLRETLAVHSIARGNGRAWIHRNLRGEPVDLEIIPPESAWTGLVIDRETRTRSKWHVYTDIYGYRHIIPDRDVLHIKGLGYDGLQGYDLVTVAKQALGLAIVGERQQARYYKNDARPSILLNAPKGTFNKPEDAQQFLNDFVQRHTGDGNGTVGMLRGDMTATTIPSSAEGQATESRTFSRQDMALLMCVESMLGDGSKGGWQSLEQKQREYRTNCLGKWMTKWTQECWIKLLSYQQQADQSHFFEWDDSFLVQADLASRADTYNKMITARVYNPNECRAEEGKPPYPGGDEFVNPNTMKDGSPTPAKEKKQPSNAVVSRVKHLAGVEAKRIKDAVKKPNFLAWYDQWTKTWTATISDAFKEAGLPEYAAQTWIADSRDRVVEATEAKADQFEAVLCSTLDLWPSRAEEFCCSLEG